MRVILSIKTPLIKRWLCKKNFTQIKRKKYIATEIEIIEEYFMYILLLHMISIINLYQLNVSSSLFVLFVIVLQKNLLIGNKSTKYDTRKIYKSWDINL